ncbi:MAG TPA: helix-turn-helix transcriptional regulator [Bacillota bacterium]
MNNLGERIRQIRKYFKMSQEEFGKIIGLSQANISKMEAGSFEPTETTINSIIARFPINPEWLRNGEGEMLISPESYLKNGIEFLGKEKLAAGIVNLLKSAEFGDVKALAGLNQMLDSGIPEEVAKYLRYIINTWNNGDAKTRHWLEMQLELAFRDVK